jgi:metal-responsive CopG/Arc/MetJ family transcriptional regulator
MVVSINVPDQVFARMERLAESEGQTVSEVVATACRSHLAAWDRLQARAARGDKEKYLALLAKVPDSEPVEGDELPPPKVPKPGC